MRSLGDGLQDRNPGFTSFQLGKDTELYWDGVPITRKDTNRIAIVFLTTLSATKTFGAILSHIGK